MSYREARTPEEQKKEWIKRNKSFIKRLERKVNDDNVVAMVMAIELVCNLMEYTDLIMVRAFNDGTEAYSVKSDLERRKEYGTRIIVDPFQPSSRVNFLYRKHRNDIRFDIPCICGSFKNEPHDVKLK